MEKLSVKFNNGYELEIDSVTESNNVINKTQTLNLRIPLIQANLEYISSIKDNITPDNMTNITVFGDGNQICEFSGYTIVHSIDKIINKFEHHINVSATKKD